MADDNKTTPKLSINELKYIVMEGGGARGATYLGAIRELEYQLKNRIKDNNYLARKNKPAIMDFLEDSKKLGADGEKIKKPIIEGVAGASAGAITTFAIVLGLNSEEIEKVLDFDFSNFLSEVDAGKYRMIDENSELKVGEDKTLYNQSDTLFETRQKTLGGKRDNFEYDLSKNKTNITGNAAKFAKRGLLFTFIVKVVVDGIVYNIGQLFRMFSNTEKPSWFQKLIKKQLGDGGQNSKEAGANFFSRMLLYSSALTVIFYGIFGRKKTGFKITPNSIMGVFADRGLYSGFQVREFFLDIMIFAATKDTYFQKQLIKFYKEKYPALSTDSFKVTNKKKNKKNESEDFVIGLRADYEFTSEFRVLFEKELKNMTFRQFYHILKVDYGVAVSNFTTNSPIYFSDKYTPNFRVLEAVGASMSIPPALRPLYNAADVVFEQHNVNEIDKVEEKLVSSPSSKKLSVTVNGNSQDFIKDGTFSRSDYELYEYATKKALQEVIKKEKGIYIDLNNVMELNTFLDYMQAILIGIRENKEKTDELRGAFPHTVDVNGNKYDITTNLLLFFYNAQFKGLLLDGGYFNNIPFNYFREKGDPTTLDGVFAIKLDRSFPPDFMAKVRDIMNPLKSREQEIIDRVDREEAELGKIIPLHKIDASDFDQEFEQVVVQIQNLLSAQILNEKKSALKRQLKKGDLSENEKKRLEGIVKNFKANRESILKIIEEWYIQNGAYNDIKPWELPRPIIDIAFTGYAYGAKRGQIRDMTDHKYIVSLYDYGVGTYDFDLDKVRLLAEFAQETAQNDINIYFETP